MSTPTLVTLTYLVLGLLSVGGLTWLNRREKLDNLVTLQSILIYIGVTYGASWLLNEWFVRLVYKQSSADEVGMAAPVVPILLAVLAVLGSLAITGAIVQWLLLGGRAAAVRTRLLVVRGLLHLVILPLGGMVYVVLFVSLVDVLGG
ncbi:hypothetical protein ACFO9Q_21860 [Paenibacillus sp. GCM10023252]|uniref:hypothetical protein n=1 Tax=Paenibacillus sp. GCM10023252 TaxID=3252649 RepID=UPI0036157E4F